MAVALSISVLVLVVKIPDVEMEELLEVLLDVDVEDELAT